MSDSPSPSRPSSRCHTSLHWSGALPLLVWCGFWSWFVLANLVSDGLALPPVLALATLWGATALTWWRPRLGAIALLAIAGLALCGLHSDSPVRLVPVWLIAVPCSAVAAIAWLGDSRRPTPATAR